MLFGVKMFFDIYKHARDLLQKIVATAATVTLGFGVTLIGVVARDGEIVEGDPYAWKSAALFTVVFFFSWLFYFLIAFKIERVMYRALKSLRESEKIDENEYRLAASMHTKVSKFVPFAVSLFLYILVILPIKA